MVRFIGLSKQKARCNSTRINLYLQAQKGKGKWHDLFLMLVGANEARQGLLEVAPKCSVTTVASNPSQNFIAE